MAFTFELSHTDLMSCLTNWVHTPDGYVADLPEGIGYSVLAEPRFASELSPRRSSQDPAPDTTPPAILGFGLFDVPCLDEIPPGSPIERIPTALALMIYTAQQYAPALALARDEMRTLPIASRAEFVEVYAERLRRRLQAQVTAPYFLALATKTSPCGLIASSYYWIVGYKPARPSDAVGYVSEDYYVYGDSIEYFDLDPNWLAARFDLQPKK